jgi:hypothetical protein
MKKNTILVCFILSIIAITYSCTKVEKPTTFSFKADGTDIVVDSTYARLYTYTGSSVARRQLEIIAYSNGKQVIEIQALPKTGSQQAVIDCFITYFVNGGYNSSDVYVAALGGVNFTVCDTASNLIQGTFSIEDAVNSDSMSRVITQGKIYKEKIEKQ